MIKNISLWICLIALTAAFSLAFFSCSSDGGTDPDDNDNNGESWEPYQFEPNTTFHYDLTTEIEGKDSTGELSVYIKNPAVEITWVWDGEEGSSEYAVEDNIKDNFTFAASGTPFPHLLHNYTWALGYGQGKDLKVGNHWSWSHAGVSYSFNVTGKEEYAGMSGYVVETEITDSNEGEEFFFLACINPDIALPLMNIWEGKSEQDEFYYKMTLVSYEN